MASESYPATATTTDPAGNPTPLPGLGVAPLSALDLGPADFIHAAHAAGYSAVGLRVEPVSPTDPPFPGDRQSPEFAGIREALNQTGLEVLDIEVLSVREDTGPDRWLPILEIGAELGASYINVAAEIPPFSRFEDIVGELTSDAGTFGLTPVLEPVAFRPLNSFDRAVEISRSTGCAVILDVLHYLRTHTSLSTVAGNRDLFPIFQICDAPGRPPSAADDLASAVQETADLIAEARSERLLPGDAAGAAPIKQLLNILGPATRISVEIPSVTLRSGSSGPEYLRFLHGAVSRYLTE
ncbi:hypothetical protein AB0P28_14920 [Pseudarthrobacter sp. NPDC089323]